jgi:hypothetical protein
MEVTSVPLMDPLKSIFTAVLYGVETLLFATVGAGGSVMVTFNTSCGAGSYAASPAWLAVIEHVPADSVVTTLPEMEHTLEDAGWIANTTGAAEPSPVADTVNVPFGVYTGELGVAMKLEIAPVAFGVTAFEAAEGAPVPVEFVAETVNVYAVPFVRPVTVHGDVTHVPVIPPGLLVAM